MATQLRTTGNIDFDDYFEPRSGQTPIATTLIQTETGQDIADRYAPASAGTPASNCGWRPIFSNSDVGPLLAAKGGVVYWDGTLAPLPTNVTDSTPTSPMEDPRPAFVEVLFNPNGDIRVRQNYPVFTESIVGQWIGQLANSTNTEIRFTGSGGGLLQNTAPSFQPMSAIQVFSLSTTGGSELTNVLVELRQTNTPASTISKTVTLFVNKGAP